MGGLEKKKVLAVDDEPAVTLLVTRVLQKAGYEVKTAASAEEALQLIESFPPDLIIVDKNLPRMSGFELIRIVRGKIPGIPVIVITAAPEPYAPGQERVDGYLAKPFRNLDILRNAVNDAFERSRAASERAELQKRLSDVMAQLRKT